MRPPGAAGAGRSLEGLALGHAAAALAAQDLPVAVGVVEAEDDGGVEVEQAPQAADRGVEHVVEVERRRQGLGDPVQREQQGVGVGQPPEAVEGEGVLAVGLAGDPPGVAGDEGHQEQHQASTGPRLDDAVLGGVLDQVRDG